MIILLEKPLMKHNIIVEAFLLKTKMFSIFYQTSVISFVIVY